VFVERLVRRHWHRWFAYSVAKEFYRAGKGINPATGRECYLAVCGICKETGFEKEMEMDHKEPVISVKGRGTLEQFITRLLCGPDGLQRVHKTCHVKKTNSENARRE